MSERFHHEEYGAADIEGRDFTISDGMDPISIPDRITKENFAAIFGAALPEGLSADMLNEDGYLELQEE